jgi:hypothetical protein
MPATRSAIFDRTSGHFSAGVFRVERHHTAFCNVRDHTSMRMGTSIGSRLAKSPVRSSACSQLRTACSVMVETELDRQEGCSNVVGER